MHKLNLKPSQKHVRDYYEAQARFKSLRVSHETAVRSAFQSLLETCGQQFRWKLVPEWPIRRAAARSLRVDGVLLDEYRLAHGYWEAKDEADDLAREVKKKLAAGYPSDNIIFQSPERAVLWQNGREVEDADITRPEALVKVLARFFEYEPPAYEEWGRAVEDFRRELPELGRALKEQIERARRENARFREAFGGFYELCRQAVNPNLSEQAVEEMLIQHILTERIFRTVFKNSDFTRRNVIAAEIEKVVDALTARSFSRESFLRRFDHFYRAVETTAATIEYFAEKQEFLNAVYEKFFRGFSVKAADTHGIVYTPQPIVDFMVRSVEELLRRGFGRSLSDEGVHVLDPFVGTGNFVVRVMREIRRSALRHKYRAELHCNEVMLLPYYIASQNIEHEFDELTGSYEPFEGVCLVDTFELAEAQQISFFTTENTARVERQKRAPIRVVIGNPPYNAWQVNENDNNKNRKYKVTDRRVAETYAKDSRATNKNALSDPYVKAIRWASDRIGEEGIVAFVTNNSFVDNLAFDGMRKHLARDFEEIYVLDLGGNVRRNPKLSGTTHNVFGIQVGVSVNLFVKRRGAEKRAAKIHYARTEEFWRKGEKYAFLEGKQHAGNVEWRELQPDAKHDWLNEGMQDEFASFLSIGSKEAKAAAKDNAQTIFKRYGRGVATSRDAWAYNFNAAELESNIKLTIDAYNEQLFKWAHSKDENKIVDEFVIYDTRKISWSRDLKHDLRRGKVANFSADKIRNALYRPFTKTYLFFDRLLNEEVYLFPAIFPVAETEEDNRVISVAGKGNRMAFGCLMSNQISALDLAFEKSQCFPFYTYDEDGANRRENITDWALEKFRGEYADASVTKWDIFYYVYAVLHHPAYRERYAANLKRELPGVPFAPDFRAFVETGHRLAELHTNYERQPEYPLAHVEAAGVPVSYRVERMRLSRDRQSIVYNDFLTLAGVPAEAFDYRLGNRSALEWVLDQYQLTTDRRSGITNDPNRPDDPHYILRLVGQIITVSLATNALVRALPSHGVADTQTAAQDL